VAKHKDSTRKRRQKQMEKEQSKEERKKNKALQLISFKVKPKYQKTRLTLHNNAIRSIFNR
jgi:hypothetical protein